MKRLAASILLLCMLSACSTVKQDQATEPGTYKHKTDNTFNGLARTYRLHIPKGYDSTPAPLLIVLHGAFSTAEAMEEQSGFSTLADRNGFYVAYPNGIGLFGKLQHWNAGHCCGKAAGDGIDDVQFIESILDDVISHHAINTDQIFLVGYSNGGMMAYRFAEERTDRLTALAVVAGALNSTTDENPTHWTPTAPSKPLPVLIIHGTKDEAVPIRGGESPAKTDGRTFTSMKEAAEFWTNNNRDSAPVTTLELPDWGHPWPGPFFTADESVRPPMQNYDAADVIWSFFEQY